MVDMKQAPEIEILKARRAMEAALTDLGEKSMEAERLEIEATILRQRADEARREYDDAVVVHRGSTSVYQLSVLESVRVDGPNGLGYCDGDPDRGDPCTNPECPPGYHGGDEDES